MEPFQNFRKQSMALIDLQLILLVTSRSFLSVFGMLTLPSKALMHLCTFSSSLQVGATNGSVISALVPVCPRAFRHCVTDWPG